MFKNRWFSEYCQKSTSPCMKYFVMKRRSLIEKTFWTLVFLCSILITFSMLRFLINIWINVPIIMFIDNKETGIQEIPFPSVTVCPSNQLRKSIWKKYENTNNSYWEQLQQYRDLVCHLPQSNHTKNLDYNSFKKLSNDCAISCHEVFQSNIKWQNLTVNNFCHYLQPKMNRIGLCFTINMMSIFKIFNNEYYQKYMNFFSKNNTFPFVSKSKWNIDDGYPLKNGILLNILPGRTSGVSYYHRLRMILHTMEDDFISCPNKFSPDYFLILISNPAEYNSPKTKAIALPETYGKIQITPFVKKIHWNLKWRSPEIRKCYLHNERQLAIFQTYTELNCRHECVINESISMCGCVAFESAYLVPSGVQICGQGKTDCLNKVEQTLSYPKMEILCKCLPTCFVLEYQITHTYHYDNWTYMKTTNLVKNNSSGLTIEFTYKNPYFTAYTSESIADFGSLIGSIGGAISLFLGLNLVNLCEMLYMIIQMIIYYITHMFVK